MGLEGHRGLCALLKMARTRYKQRPQFWYCIQYSGTNSAEIISHCPQCKVDPKTGKLLFNGLEVMVGNWVLEDIGGLFSMMIDSQFQVFFSLDPGPAAI